MRFFLVSIAKIELFCWKNKKKKTIFFRNRSRNRSHFSQPFPKRFLSFLLYLS